MTDKLLWGVVIGAALGAALGTIFGNTAIGIAICVAAGSITAAIVHQVQKRRDTERLDGR